MNDKLRLLTGFSLVLALGFAPACNGGKEDDTSTSEGSSTASDESTTSDGMTTTPMTDSADSGTSTSTTTTDGTISTTAEPTTGPVCEMADLGAACADAECDCASGNCFVVGPLGGVCSECDEDADCADTTGFGCNFGNPLTMTPAVCSTSGDIGESCESADVCAAGLFCPTLIEVPGILSASTCSECESSADCMGGQVCTPTYDIANIGGFWHCVDPGTVPNDEGCNLTGDGSECESGQCAPASLMGIPVVAVCSPCNEDADCMGGGTCQLPEIAIDGNSLAVVPGMCV